MKTHNRRLTRGSISTYCGRYAALVRIASKPEQATCRECVIGHHASLLRVPGADPVQYDDFLGRTLP